MSRGCPVRTARPGGLGDAEPPGQAERHQRRGRDGAYASRWTLAIEDDDVKVVVLTGAGRAFSAGYDIAEEVEQKIDGAERWHDVLAHDVELTMELWALPKPTIAAVRGWCLAGACELAMACDLVVAADDAQFGEPEIRYGSGPVTLLMPFVLGQKKTNELLFTGDAITATEAERLGLVNAVVAVRRARGRGRTRSSPRSPRRRSPSSG